MEESGIRERCRALSFCPESVIYCLGGCTILILQYLVWHARTEVAGTAIVTTAVTVMSGISGASGHRTDRLVDRSQRKEKTEKQEDEAEQK